MKKLIKLIVIFLLSLIIIAAMAVGVLVTLVNPNSFKPMISRWVQANTGKTFMMDGDIRWSFYPTMGLNMGHMILTDATNTKVAEVSEASAQVKCLPLLSGHLKINQLSLVNLVLHVSAADYKKIKLSGSASAPKTEKNKTEILPPIADFSIERFAISNADISWIDGDTGQKTNIQSLNLTIKKLYPNVFFPLTFNFKLAMTQPVMQSQIAFHAQTKIDFSRPAFHFKDMDFNIQMGKESKKISLHLAGNLVSDLQQLQTLFQGTLDYNRLQFRDVNAKAFIKKGVLYLEPFNATAYQGQLESRATIHYLAKEPSVVVSAVIKNMQAKPLFEALADHSQLSGVMNVRMEVGAHGSDANTLIKTLVGTANIDFADGALEGFDIQNLILTAAALAKQQVLPQSSNHNQTTFSHLTGSAKMINGIMYNDDLMLTGVGYQITGKGEIDLVNHKINYHLSSPQVLVKNTHIPILVKGNLSNPSVRLDTDAILKEVLINRRKKIEEKIQEKATDLLNNLIH